MAVTICNAGSWGGDKRGGEIDDAALSGTENRGTPCVEVSQSCGAGQDGSCVSRIVCEPTNAVDLRTRKLDLPLEKARELTQGVRRWWRDINQVLKFEMLVLWSEPHRVWAFGSTVESGCPTYKGTYRSGPFAGCLLSGICEQLR